MEQKSIQMAELLSGEVIDKAVADKLVSAKARELSEQNKKKDEVSIGKMDNVVRRTSEPRLLCEILKEIINESDEPWVVGLRKRKESQNG